MSTSEFCGYVICLTDLPVSCNGRRTVAAIEHATHRVIVTRHNTEEVQRLMAMALAAVMIQRRLDGACDLVSP